MSILSNVISGISSVLGSGASYKGQKSANQTNIRLAREAREHDLNMWNMQNAYNTPEMQMQRLKEAGLNPNLIYGSGSASTGNADAVKPAQVANVSNELSTFANNQAISMLSQYQDWQVKKAQIKNIEAETEAKRYGNQYQSYLAPNYSIMADAERNYNIHKASSQHLQSLEKEQDWLIKANQHQSDLRKGAYDSRSSLHNLRLNESQERINYLKQSARQKALQIQLDEQLKPYGMSTADELWQRKLVPLIEDLLTPQKWIRNKFKNK